MSETNALQSAAHLDASQQSPASDGVKQDTSSLKDVKRLAYQVLERSLSAEGLDKNRAQDQLDIIKRSHKNDTQNQFLDRLMDTIRDSKPNELANKSDIIARINALSKAVLADTQSVTAYIGEATNSAFKSENPFKAKIQTISAQSQSEKRHTSESQSQNNANQTSESKRLRFLDWLFNKKN